MDRPRERARRGRSVADQAWLPCIEGLLQSRLLAASKIRVLVDLLGTDHSAPVDLSPPLRGGEVTNLGYDALRVHPCPDQSPALGSVRGCSHHPDPPLSGSESSGSSPSAAKMRARPLSLGLCPGSGASKWERDRKSTRLNSSHVASSYAVFCLKKKILEQDTKHSQP